MSYTVLAIIIIRDLGVMYKLKLGERCVKIPIYTVFV